MTDTSKEAVELSADAGNIDFDWLESLLESYLAQKEKKDV